ncbi:MAG: NAD(P)/FAD-dependent oxidoreductase [Parvularculaceae bacterium]
MSDPQRQFDIAVIGAGVIGSACALRLAQSGKSVILCDRGAPGKRCSFGNAGHLTTEEIFPLPSIATLMTAPGYLLQEDPPLTIRARYALKIAPWLARFAWASRPAAHRRGTQALLSLQARARNDFLRLAKDAGAGDLVRADGSLLLVERAGSVAAVKKHIDALHAHGVAAEWLDPAGAHERLGRRTPALSGAVYYPGAGHVVDPLAIVESFADAAVGAGAQFRRCNVAGVARGGGGYILLTSAGEIGARAVVIAAGAWSRPLLKSLGFDVPLDTERGYHLMAEGASTTCAIPAASHERKVIVTPMAHGVRITGAIEFGGLELPEDAARYPALERALNALAPEVDTSRISRWMGFRPSLPDLLPVIGPAPGEPNLLFAFGHQHVGLTLSGVTAEIIRCLIDGAPPPVDLAPFRVERFARARRSA